MGLLPSPQLRGVRVGMQENVGLGLPFQIDLNRNELELLLVPRQVKAERWL